MPKPDTFNQASKACLNCRERKIACDRQIPACSSCQRRKKTCIGYDNNLSWPRKGDHRRAVTAKVQSRPYGKGGITFLNTSSWDASLCLEYTESGTHSRHIGMWRPTLYRSLQLPRFGTTLAPLYDNEVTSAVRLITSRGDLRQDVCGLLRRMSLTDDSLPSLAVRYSMNAISYLYHQQPDEAMLHQTLAVSALQGVLTREVDANSRAQAIAASLLLSLYEVLCPAGKSSTWSVHFDGCMTIVKSGRYSQRKYVGEHATLLDWVFYHDVLYKFSLQHWQQRTRQMEDIAGRRIFPTTAAFGDHFHTIHSTLGCSLELLELLSQALNLVKKRDDPAYLSKGHSHAIDLLERRVRNIDQRLCGGIDKEEFHVPGSRIHYTRIARMYQLALIIYIDRVVRGSPFDSNASQSATRESFSLLKILGVCERPFVMLVLAMQAKNDEERRLLLSALDEATRERPLSNLTATEQMIRRVWAQQDLQGINQADMLFILNAIVSSNRIPPSFT